MNKLKIIMFTLIMCFVLSGACWGAEPYTRTLYNNKVPYKAFFANQYTNKIKVQKGNVQVVIPVVNDVKKDLTKEVKKGS